MTKLKLSARIRSFYEDRFRYLLPRKAYYVVRIDGKNFSAYTRRLIKPFDPTLISHFDQTTIAMCQEIPGTILSYTQSDEISIVFTDTASYDTELWYDGNIQKISSITASLATSYFNSIRAGAIANFDSRVFPIPREEVKSYLIARQNDALRNAISSAARSQFSTKALVGKKSSEQLAMLKTAGVEFSDYPAGALVGRTIRKLPVQAADSLVTRNKFQVDPANPLFREFDFQELLSESNQKTRADPNGNEADRSVGAAEISSNARVD